MNIDVAAIIAALFGGFATIAGGLKWWVNRLDAKEQKEKQDLRDERVKDIIRQDQLREELKEEMQERIDALMKTVAMQGKLIGHYMNHIRLLEKQMSKAGIDVPEMHPPVGLEGY